MTINRMLRMIAILSCIYAMVFGIMIFVEFILGIKENFTFYACVLLVNTVFAIIAIKFINTNEQQPATNARNPRA
jgi:predicted lipid-binding transport protein (Tim44 family)